MEKKKIGLIVSVIILSILVVALSGYIVFDKVLSNNKTETNNHNSEKVNNSDNTNLFSNEEAIIEGKRLYDKATEIYETWVFAPYCGLVRKDIIKQDTEDLACYDYGTCIYYKSKFKSLDDLKNNLKQWLSEDIVNKNVVKTYVSNNITDYKYAEDLSLLLTEDYRYVDYVLKDDTLYCRAYWDLGWLTLYQNKYDIKVKNIEEDKITYTITSAYANEDSGCGLGTLDSKPCREDELEYKDTTFVIERNKSGNFVVSEYTLHD